MMCARLLEPPPAFFQVLLRLAGAPSLSPLLFLLTSSRIKDMGAFGTSSSPLSLPAPG